MQERLAWVHEHHDHLRRALLLEPRGHRDMYGALLTEPERPGSDAGVLFMHNDGYSAMCGHGVIAVVTIALERGLLMPREGSREVVLDTPAGQIRATAKKARGAGDDDPVRVESVSFRNVPSFVLHAGVAVQVGSRHVLADVAYGGAFFAIVDSEAIGIPIAPARLPELRKAGMEVKHAVERGLRVAHPDDAALHGINGTIFTGPPSKEGVDLRNVTVFADAGVDRSPCGTGTSAVMAVLSAMGLLGTDHTFTHESIIGTTFRGRVVGETMVGETPAIVPEIEGEAWITGEHTFLLDERDPMNQGFRL